MPRRAIGDYPDVVVVGSGLGGLGCAARLARGGARVALFERQEQIGGYASHFRRDPFSFEVGLHLMDAVGEGEPNHRLLAALGVADRLAWTRPEILRHEIGPERRAIVPRGIDAWRAGVAASFPGEEAGVAALCALARETHDAWLGAEEVAYESPIVAPPSARGSAADLLDGLLGEPRLKASLAVFSAGWLGAPLARIPAPRFLVPWYSYQAFGGGYPAGGSQALCAALAAVVEEAGGAVHTAMGVRRIVTERGRAAGVELDDGRRVASRFVVSNADPATTFGRLVDAPPTDARYLGRLGRLVPTVSCVKVWLGLDRTLDEPAGFDVTLLGRGDGADPSSAPISVVTRSALGRQHVPPGRDVVEITLLVRGDAWRDAEAKQADLKERVAQALIARVERELYPGLRERAVMVEAASPRTFERYTGQPFGCIYGGTLDIAAAPAWRLDAATPLRGLALVGAWTGLGGGYSAVMRTAKRTAEWILRAISGGGA